MRFGFVAGVVLPPATLLHTDISPLELSQSSILGKISGRVLGENNMPVFEFTILVFLRVFDLLKSSVINVK